MALNPQERKEFILDCMPHIANGVLSDTDLLKAMDHAHSRGEPNRGEQIINLVYLTSVALADKYDAENP